MASSDGIFARDLRLNQSISAQVICSDAEHRASCHKRLGESGNLNFYEKINIHKLTDELAETAGNMLYADYVTSGTYPVVLANQFGGVIFHEACGHLLETTAVQRNSTPFAKKKNEKITFDKIEHSENEINKNILDLIKIKEYIETIINKYNNILSLYLNIKQSLNNHQLRSGLQGQIIQQINNTNPKTIKKIIKLLPKPITHLISRNKYVDTPFRAKDIYKSTQL